MDLECITADTTECHCHSLFDQGPWTLLSYWKLVVLDDLRVHHAR